jgi:hypothetical protein
VAVSGLGGAGGIDEGQGDQRARTSGSLFALHNRINFLDFCRMKGNEILNYVFTKILKIKSSF